MTRKNGFLFIVSSAVAFIAFAAIAMGIQATGLVRMNEATIATAIPVATSTPTITPRPTLTPVPGFNDHDWEALMNELADEEQEWLALEIDDYRIEVSVSSTWVNHSVTVEVRDGEIVRHSVECSSPTAENGDCLFVRPVEEYIVPFLFNTVRNLPVSTEALDAVVTPEVSYDAIYHIPTQIVYVPINIFDAGIVYEVLSFEILSETTP